MTGEVNGALLATIAVFARVGGCFMVAPAFSGSPMPMQVRLLFTLATSVSLASFLDIAVAVDGKSGLHAVVLIVAPELLTGFALGMLARLFFMAIAFVGETIGATIGLSGMPGVSFEAGAQDTVTAALVNVTALTAFVALDLHHLLIRALALSYDSVGVGQVMDARLLAEQAVDAVSASFDLAIRLASPFVAYALLANFIAGLLNKLVPQIPTYFVSMPVMIGGGLFLLMLGIGRIIGAFDAQMEDFLRSALF